MKQLKKLTLTSIKIKSFATSLSTIESINIKGGETFDGCNTNTNNLMACTTRVSGNPKCHDGPGDDI